MTKTAATVRAISLAFSVPQCLEILLFRVNCLVLYFHLNFAELVVKTAIFNSLSPFLINRMPILFRAATHPALRLYRLYFSASYGVGLWRSIQKCSATCPES